ncbi:MAG TPA: ROK family protein [Candidatus Saccharimonadia bacterium]|nr:ROK family protein [Candidatus Saccharimonadia bacterium]
MPRVSQAHIGMVDAGGTHTRVVVATESGREVYAEVFASHEYAGLDEVLTTAFEAAGVVPGRMAFGLAGPYNSERGRLRFGNRPEWPDFDLAATEQRWGCRGRVCNDVELQAAAAAATAPEHLVTLKPGRLWPAGRTVVLTLSTGLGVALAEAGHTIATEFGSEGVVPLTDDEADLARFVAADGGTPYAPIGGILDGGSGFGRAHAWLLARGEHPAAATRAQLDKLRAAGADPGPAITAAAAHDPFAGRIMRTMGGLYGTYLRQLMNALQPTAGLHLVGAVNQAAAEFWADPAHSPLLERLTDPRLDYADEVAGFTLILNRDPQLARRGGLALARSIT